MGLWWMAVLTTVMLLVVAVRTNDTPKRVDLHRAAAEREKKNSKGS
jgi:hypothetical protein